MIARAARPRRRRAGITLTEILIAIMIMGVGLISLATLFPLGLLRMQKTTQYNRTALLFESAADEMDARALLTKTSFMNTWYGPYRDPFTQDALANGSYVGQKMISAGPLGTGTNAGLPFVYDPLWRAITGVVPPFSIDANTSGGYADNTLDFAAGYVRAVNEARFGQVVYGNTTFTVRNDPQGGLPSGYGLQRLTNFIPYSTAKLTPYYGFTHTNISLGAASQRPDGAVSVFVSPDDIVFNPIDKQNVPSTANTTSPLLPDTSVDGSIVQDFRFSWFFTGALIDKDNGTQYAGNIVVCDGRPFAFDSVTINGETQNVPAGEQTVEAVFGFGTNFNGATGNAMAVNAKRKVLLRWPVGVPDPQVRPGGWIADVTYERNQDTYTTRKNAAATPFVRCYWYQVAQRTEAETESATSPGVNSAGLYRRMIVTLSTDVRAQTLLNTGTAEPVNCNFALIMPSVINVFSRAFEVHN